MLSYVRVSVLCILCVLGAGAGAGAKRRRAKPVDPAGEVSCAGGALAHAAAIRELVVTTDPLVCDSCCCEMEMILRCLIAGET